MNRGICGILAAVMIGCLSGCSAVPSPTLDEEVMEAASRAESAAADAASALAAAQSATEAANATFEAGDTLDADIEKSKDKTVKMTPLVSESGRYTIYIPESWQNMNGQIDPEGMDRQFEIEAGSYDRQVFLLFNDEPMEDSGLASFDDFFSSLTRGVTGSSLLSEVQMSNPESITLKESQLPGRKLGFTALYHPPGLPEQRISYRIYGAQGGAEYYQFCCWTTAANSAMMADLLDTVVNSFRINS